MLSGMAALTLPAAAARSRHPAERPVPSTPPTMTSTALSLPKITDVAVAATPALAR